MQRQSSFIRCIMALCFGSAIALAAFEWRSPVPDLVITPEDTLSIDLSPRKSKIGQSGIGQLIKWPWATEKLDSFDELKKFPAKASAAQASPVQLTLSLSNRSLEVSEPGKITTVYEVAVGQEDWQTPTGEFAVMSKLENPAWQHPLTKEEITPGPDNPLGSRWIGFWSDGEAQIGFHGTNQEDLIGEAVSHGCVRMRDRDMQELYNKLDIGTKVVVVP